jgi:hypothetical protein
MGLRTKLGVSLVAVAVAGTAAGLAISVSGTAGAAAGAPDGAWGSVQEIRGVAALTQTPGGHNPSSVSAVGCSTLGNCAAVGDYGSPVTGATVPFVATEVNGAWRNAQPLTGLPATAPGTAPTLTNVSCGPPDFCTAAGTYYDTGSVLHVFEVTETGGTWGGPVELDASGLGDVQSLGVNGLSCPAAGECSLIGYSTLTAATPAAFTADESGGKWTALQPLAGLASLAPSSASPVTGGLTSLSCGAPGACTAGGLYFSSNSQYGGVQQPFIVSESGHSWGKPQPIPGIASVSSSGAGDNSLQNEVTSVSCPDATHCAVAGTLFPQLNSAGLFFTLDEAGGTWGQAKALSLPAADSVDAATAPLVSCRSAGNCVIAATVANEPGQSSSGSSAVVTAAESSSGAWGVATAITGIAAGDEGQLANLACVPAGDCTVLGVYYPGGSDPNEIFSATSADGGAMGAAQQVASSGNITPLGTRLVCPKNGHCTVTYNGVDATVGQYNTYNGLNVPELVTEATPVKVTVSASAKLTYGAEQSAKLRATVSSPAGGTPTGTVTVTGPGGSALCAIALSNGTGTCALTATKLPVGTDALTAAYGGDVTYQSASGTDTVTVARAATVTRLAFTPRSISFSGAATKLAVTGSVSSTVGKPGGLVTVRVDGKAVAGCANVPFTGTVSCQGTTAVLAGGKHLVVLAYSGRGDFAASTSAALPLTVAKRGTTTTLALARTSVTYGHESAEKFTVSVSRAGGVYPTGKVSVRIGGTTICTITPSKGTGSCALANARLRVGTYTFVARYSGNGNYDQSQSAKKTLKVEA